MVKKTLAFGIVLLFIGVAFAPSLYADLETISEQNKLVELTIEFYGLDKTDSHKVTVTREDADKLDLLFVEVRNELNNATTNSERISIFNDCIVELDKLGLLGENSIGEVQTITMGLYKEQIDCNLEDADINYNCLIIGRTTNTYFFYSKPVLENIILNLDKYIDPFINLIKNKYLRSFIALSIVTILVLLYFAEFKMMHSDSTITYGRYYQPYDERAQITYADGWIWTLGKNGIVEFDGGQGKLGAIGGVIGIFPEIGFLYYYIGAKNFIGIRLIGIKKIDGKNHAEDKYIGFASEVSIG